MSAQTPKRCSGRRDRGLPPGQRGRPPPPCRARPSPTSRRSSPRTPSRSSAPAEGESSATPTSSTTRGRARWRSSRSTTRRRATTRAGGGCSPTTPGRHWSQVSQTRGRRHVRLPRRRTGTSTSRWRLRPLRGRPGRLPRRARRGVAQERLLHRGLLPATTPPSRTPARSSGPRGSCADPRRCAASRSAGPTSTTTATRPGDPVRRRSRRHVLVPGDGRPEQRLRRGRQDQQRDRRQGDVRRKVTPGQVTHPDTTPPPISLTAPSDRPRSTASVTLSRHGRDRAACSSSSTARRSASPRSAAPTPSPGTRPWSSTASTGCRPASWRRRARRTLRGHPVTVANAPRLRRMGRALRGTRVSLDGSESADDTPVHHSHVRRPPGGLVTADGQHGGTDGPHGRRTHLGAGGRANQRAGTSEVWKALAPGTLPGTPGPVHPRPDRVPQSLRWSRSAAPRVSEPSSAGGAVPARRSSR